MSIVQPIFSISFIIPALNEEKVIGKFLEQLLLTIIGQHYVYEVILVNDGSSDRTGEIMESTANLYENVRVLHNSSNIGFGNSFKRGLAEARHDYLMLLCGDGGLPAKSLPPILDKVGTADIVIPWITNLSLIKSSGRFLLSKTYSALLNISFGLSIKYYNGLPIYKREQLQQIIIGSSGFGFQAEIIVKLVKSGCTYVQVGVMGAEEKGTSLALRPRNCISVAWTLLRLLSELRNLRRIDKVNDKHDI